MPTIPTRTQPPAPDDGGRDLDQVDEALLAEGLWDAADVARFLKISARSVYDLPGLPWVRLRIKGERHLKRYLPAEVRAWTRARLTHSLLQRTA